MSSVRSLTRLALTSAQVLLGSGAGALALGTPKSCPKPLGLSCHNTTKVADLCCFNAPGGQLLQTQFWDTDPATGPADSWTLHGLWPDRCDGTYDQYCDKSREYANITDILQSFGEDDLLTYMDTYWKDYQGDDESFWEHEWQKHGTCISTLEPECYKGYESTQEAVDYFTKAVELFKTLPTYDWLAEAGIKPTTNKTYTFSAIQDALQSQHGNEVTLGCKNGVFNEVWYHYEVRGSIQLGQFVSSAPDGTKSTCPTSGIKYVPK
jgi:ribonuclease T2